MVWQAEDKQGLPAKSKQLLTNDSQENDRCGILMLFNWQSFVNRNNKMNILTTGCRNGQTMIALFMKIWIADTYENLSSQLTDHLFRRLQGNKSPLLCVASGDSPKGLYKEITARASQQKVTVSGWAFVGLDEWLGMNGNDEGSCRFHLDNDLFDPLNVAEENICFFDGRAKDLNTECNRIESFIQQRGGIEVAILGLGMNGHVGMNEPGISPLLHAHVADLHPVTQQVGQKYFTQQQELSGGLTLGIADLMEARTVFLVVNGRHKADVVKKLLEGPVTEDLPASLLRNHPDLHVYLDKEVASLLQNGEHAS